ncbi:MAG: hypothetical protein NVS2B16_27650 [Chloroflexota bacterium]
MDAGHHPGTHDADGTSIQNQLQKAASDLWAMTLESGGNFVVFQDRRRLQARVEQGQDSLYHVSWEPDEKDGPWRAYERAFEDLREAAFHAYQGPH